MMEQATKRRNALVEWVRLIAKDPAGLLGLIIVTLFVVWALIQGSLEIAAVETHDPRLAFVLLPHNPMVISQSTSLLPPSFKYIMGTNADGQDIWSRILYSIPYSAAYPAFVVVLSAILIGAVLGIAAGYFGGWWDEILMRITDAFLSVPAIVLAIVVAVLLHASFIGMIYAFIIIWWPIYARLFRAETLKVKSMDYIAAAQLYRVSPLKLFTKYLFMNAVDPIIAYAMLDFGNVILTASVLNFIGVGIQPGTPILGTMASDGVSYGFPRYWWWAIYPSLAVLVIALGFVLLGDRLQDIIGGRAAY
ncbi:peptide transporter permease [Thermocladium modestius]|uniref:Peptide transporter permease n=1 Tax=Thermocladium modestius TaxID=62609 RepID=A0A830GVN1_9CREN|nr:ABC transporter permease [Thermocladium modestius]GGP22362.1 peptide transporter permease [Thermocladium modestius]